MSQNERIGSLIAYVAPACDFPNEKRRHPFSSHPPFARMGTVVITKDSSNFAALHFLSLNKQWRTTLEICWLLTLHKPPSVGSNDGMLETSSMYSLYFAHQFDDCWKKWVTALIMILIHRHRTASLSSISKLWRKILLLLMISQQQNFSQSWTETSIKTVTQRLSHYFVDFNGSLYHSLRCRSIACRPLRYIDRYDQNIR